MRSMQSAALKYAEQGFPVFPLCERSKYPVKGSHGLYDGTTERRLIEEWWSRNPRYNVSVVTGEQSGLLVIDVDRHNGGFESMYALTEKHGRLPVTRRVATPSGGCHLWFCWPSGKDIGNSQGRVGKGIDVKGNRGAIVAPPSRVRAGSYVLMPKYGYTLAEPPEWLVEACMPPPVPHVEVSGYISAKDNYTRKILHDELGKVRNASTGQRNAALSASAWNIGKLVNSGLCDGDEAFGELFSAACSIGLPCSEARYTILQAFRKAPQKTAAAYVRTHHGSGVT